MRISDWSSDVCSSDLYHIEPGQLLMIVVCLTLIYLAIRKGFEPLLLISIGFGGVLANIPVANMAEGAAPKRVVQGKSVSVRVDLGGRRNIKKKMTDTSERANNTKHKKISTNIY